MDVTVPTRNSIISAAKKILMIKQTPYFTIQHAYKSVNTQSIYFATLLIKGDGYE